MKTFRNLLVLFVAASLLSSCYVQETGYRPHRHVYYREYERPYYHGY